MDDLGGDREQKTVRGWRHLAPRYKRDVKECIILELSLTSRRYSSTSPSREVLSIDSTSGTLSTAVYIVFSTAVLQL